MIEQAIANMFLVFIVMSMIGFALLGLLVLVAITRKDD